MTRYLITDHDRAWNYTKREGYFLIKFQADGENKNLKFEVTTADEFNAVTDLLREPKVYLYDNGSIGTDPTD